MNRGKSFGIGDFSGIKSKVAYLISSTDTMSMRNKMSSCEIIGESREKFTSLWKKFCAITCCHSTSMLLKLLNYRVNDNQYTTLWLYVNVILMMINILCYNMNICNTDRDIKIGWFEDKKAYVLVILNLCVCNVINILGLCAKIRNMKLEWLTIFLELRKYIGDHINFIFISII